VTFWDEAADDGDDDVVDVDDELLLLLLDELQPAASSAASTVAAIAAARRRRLRLAGRITAAWLPRMSFMAPPGMRTMTLPLAGPSADQNAGGSRSL